MERLHISAERLNAGWISAAEGSLFVQVITDFTDRIKELGPMGENEGLKKETLQVNFKAAKLAMEGKKLRLIFATQAKYMKDGDTYRELPDDHKLSVQLKSALSDEIAKQGLLLHLQDLPKDIF